MRRDVVDPDGLNDWQAYSAQNQELRASPIFLEHRQSAWDVKNMNRLEFRAVVETSIKLSTVLLEVER